MATEPSIPVSTPPPSPLKGIDANLIENPASWLEEALAELTRVLITFLPNLLGAIALLIIGWLIAYGLRWLIHRFGKGLDALLTSVHRLLGQEVTRSNWSVSSLVGNTAYWITLVYAISAAAEQLGLQTLSQWVLGLLGYLPRVLISAFILFIAYLIAEGVRNIILDLADANGFEHGVALGQLTSSLILAFALLISLSQIGLDVSLFSQIIVLAAGALLGSAGLAFGLGAADSVRNVMASHYVRKTFRTGQHVRVSGHEGEIIEFTQVSVIIETDEGDVMVPARQFLENVTVVLNEEGLERV